MPKSLLERYQPDSICEFRAAAKQRSRDAQALLAAERRTAAIYLWGYAAEMTLKASYFTVFGFSDIQHITMADLHAAKNAAPHFGVAPFANLHDIRGWAELLVATRASIPGVAFPIPGFGNNVVTGSKRIHVLWRETLRYHKNVAYGYELEQVQTAAQWLLANSVNL